jgi:hypothetical protein
VRSRVGLTVPQEQVLSSPGVRDRWLVLGLRDEQEEQLTVRRVWLRGVTSRRPALVLSFAAVNQPLSADLVPGTVIDAELHFYPGSQPLRALVGTRHGAPVLSAAGAVGSVASDIPAELVGYASALAAEPWLEAWPFLLSSVTPVRLGSGWHLVQPDGLALPLHPGVADPWVLVAACGGRPAAVAAEWTPRGLRPLTGWASDRLVLL